ncbi:hypothetical protein OSH11_22925 [Kaistia dalseonensis]|uniref:Uncharacterized protein n=1 Tax=Kaistia dalseonensis TaxID=410840 RepID=A0ABU0HD18_9HYPH|nr:hypothetical protein [Kaistia dalseonensis]MCX5497570.1 hypothetical protein [Kaistia dalseonensis]MDQ0440210.1 hypothetical protein [Kaistia dalseonensis]
MSKIETGGDNPLHARPISLEEAIDCWGPDLSNWPDIALVRRAREALLANRSFRAHRDLAVADAQRLKATAAALDQRIADRGSLGRIEAGVLRLAQPKPVHWYRRIAAVAAVMVVAAMLGSAVEFASAPGTNAPSVQIVQLDPLMFGPADF